MKATLSQSELYARSVVSTLRFQGHSKESVYVAACALAALLSAQWGTFDAHRFLKEQFP